MDSSEPEASIGKMWIVVAFGGSIGRFRLAVCVIIWEEYLDSNWIFLDV